MPQPTVRKTAKERRNVQIETNPSSNIVSLQNLQKSSKVILVEPRVYAEAQDISEHLKNKRAVVVNLQRIDKDQGIRIVDFLSDNLFNDVKNFWISAGGDLIAKGGGENNKGWKIGVQNPNEPEKEIFSVQTKGEKIGIATSAIFKRKGEAGGFKWNHLIDPRTGLPVENNIIAATAIAPTAQKADVYAKTALILGKDEGMKFVESKENSACIIFLKDGSMALSKNALKYF